MGLQQSPGSLTQFWRSIQQPRDQPDPAPVADDLGQRAPTPARSPRAERRPAPDALGGVAGSAAATHQHRGQPLDSYGTCRRVCERRIPRRLEGQWHDRQRFPAAVVHAELSVGHLGTAVSGTPSSPVSQGAPAHGLRAAAQAAVETASQDDDAQTPIVRESPFLYLDGDDYKVFVPKAKTSTSGVDWSTDAASGDSICDRRLLHRPEGDSAATINAALASGKNLLVTPGVYRLDPRAEGGQRQTPSSSVSDMPPWYRPAATPSSRSETSAGVKIAGITVDAGTTQSDVLVKIGPDGRPRGRRKPDHSLRCVHPHRRRVGGQSHDQHRGQQPNTSARPHLGMARGPRLTVAAWDSEHR